MSVVDVGGSVGEEVRVRVRVIVRICWSGFGLGLVLEGVYGEEEGESRLIPAAALCGLVSRLHYASLQHIKIATSLKTVSQIMGSRMYI